jgi:hypothetical protein
MRFWSPPQKKSLALGPSIFLVWLRNCASESTKYAFQSMSTSPTTREITAPANENIAVGRAPVRVTSARSSTTTPYPSILHTICPYTRSPRLHPASKSLQSNSPGPDDPVASYLLSHQRGDKHRLKDARARTTPRPNILQANSQIRGEALEEFYQMNDFVFENCDPCFLTKCIYSEVQPEHLKYIKSISWDGPVGGTSEECYCPLDKDHICSTIMLMQLGFLGQCKLRLRCTLEDYDVHLGCVLHRTGPA